MDPSPVTPAPPGHKTYVFVDEYNRHKRLKVMRACDGCRKRKIRCDGAIQNGPWPCGSCIRLKLKCVPPILDQDDEQTSPDDTSYATPVSFQSYTPASDHQPSDSPRQPSESYEWHHGVRQSLPGRNPVSASGPTSAPVSQQDARTTTHPMHAISPLSNHGLEPQRFQTPQYASNPGVDRYRPHSESPRLVRSMTEASNTSSGDPRDVDAAVRELSGQMGDLSIELTSVAPYITKEKQTLAEIPAFEELDVELPASVRTDSAVRIPVEMMPSEERAMDYFGYYFEHIHPYVPVLHRREFYEQWHSAREFISPLILEGIFACVARYLEEPIEVRRWLALASRHEESFKDVPRLSTIQAMIILTKAREAVPKRGYYYRSWMAVKYMTTMALDLGIHEHHDQHHPRSFCKLSRSDCMIRTRIWQSLFMLELFVGGPQGRSDFTVELETVNYELPDPLESDDFEYNTSRRTTYFAQTVRNVKRTNALWQSMKRLKVDWALDPRFVDHNDAIDSWLEDLPSDLQLDYGDKTERIALGGSHFVAYLHMYHNLVVIMHHRPQLQMLLEKRDADFQIHLDTCNESAVIICRLQEALYRDFGLHGLQFMQRGIGFTIYCILTCTMLHLATITSPEPSVNSRARTYFTRHMRILELCIPNASVEMQVQINALRDAFSQDTTKAFELKHALGPRSPSLDSQMSTPSSHQEPRNLPVQKVETWPYPESFGSSKTMSPSDGYSQPINISYAQPTTTFNSSSFSMPSQETYPPNGLNRVTSAPEPGYQLHAMGSNEQTTPIWNPSDIFSQWNTAFGQPQAAVPPPVPTVSAPLAPFQTAASTHQSPGMSGQRMLFSHQPATSSPASQMPEIQQNVPTVTPVMWQNAFTNAYVSGQGQKRYREDNVDANFYRQYQKRRG